MGRMRDAIRLLSLSLALLGAFTGQGWGLDGSDLAHLRGASEPTRKRLESAAEKLARGQAADAVDELDRLLSEAGDDLVSADGQQFRAARWQAHALLARLPPQTLASYRDRIDGPAQKLLEQAQRSADLGPLWQIVDRYFVSRPAEEAIRLLGDRLFAQGEFQTAERLWQRLVPQSPADMAYPTPPAESRITDEARLILSAIYQGDVEGAEAQLAAFRQKHGDAAGVFAGVHGPYGAALESLLRRPPIIPLDSRWPTAWPTLFGSASRDGFVSGRLPRHWPSRPTWVVTLPPNRPLIKGLRPEATLPPYEPVIINGRVILTDGIQAYAIDVQTGERSSVLLELDGNRPARSPRPDFSVTVLSTELVSVRGRRESRLVGLGVPGRGHRQSLLPLWHLAPPSEADLAWEFQGQPLVANGRLWSLLSRDDGGMRSWSLACYEAVNLWDAPTAPRWVVPLCDASSGADTSLRCSPPTLAGRHVIVCPNAGAVIALNALTGQRSWAFRYPRSVSRTRDAPSGTRVAVVASSAGRVFVAPTDSDRLLALDAETGALLWESPASPGTLLLGVISQRLIVATDKPSATVKALEARTGSHRPPRGWVQLRPGLPKGFGPGFVTQDAIFWPTHSGLCLLDPASGELLVPPLRPARDPQDDIQPAETFGPIAFADGCLVAVVPTLIDGVARDQVWGYVAEAANRPEESPPGR